MSSKGRGQHRKNCLLAFIEECLGDPSLNHLIRWSDKSKEIFQVLWVHAGRSNYYRKTQGCLFDLYREYRGRGMTSDPKQAFRMALKKSPCIKAVSSPNIQEDWRTFQIVLKCHQFSSSGSECISVNFEKSSLKIPKSEKNVQMEEPNSKLIFEDSVVREVEKRISSVVKKKINTNCEKLDAPKAASHDDAYADLNFQNNYFSSQYQSNVNNPHINDTLIKNEAIISNTYQDDDTICCTNPCCRYSPIYNKMSGHIIRNMKNKSVMSRPFSQRNASMFSPPIVSDPYSIPPADNQPLDNYFPISFEAQEESVPLAFDSDMYNWPTNAKANINQCSWKTNISQPDYPAFQTTYENDYNNQALNDIKYFPSLEADLLATPCLKPSEEISQKNSCIVEYNYAAQGTDQCIDSFYTKQDSYGKCNPQSYQYSQQMIACNWM